MQTLELHLPANETAPGAARRELADFAAVPDDRLQDALLLVSELVSNAVRHGTSGKGSIGMRVRSSPGLVRVEIEDGGAGFTLPDDDSVEQLPGSGGLGLRLIRSLADRWGIDASPRTVVWFELECA